MSADAALNEILRGAVRDLLVQAASAADAVAVAAPARESLSYGQLIRQVDETVRYLNQLHLGRGDRVGLVVPNGPEMAVAFLGVASACTCAPINPAFRETEFRFVLNDLDARAVVVLSRFDSPVRGAAAAVGVPVIELVPNQDGPAGGFRLSGAGLERPAQLPGFAEPDDVALVLHTSGTTARPKVVPLTHKNLFAAARFIGRSLELTPGDRCLNVMPLFHIHGLVAGTLASLGAGASVACAPGFFAPRFLTWMEELRPTWYTAVPTMHQALLASVRQRRSREEVPRLRFVRSASAALSPRVMAELESIFHAPAIEAYGMTEAAAILTSNPLPPRSRKPGSVGLPAGPELAVVDDQGTPLRRGRAGEVVTRGPNVTSGYLGAPSAGAGAFRDGWLRTGDLGYFDDEGYLYLTGRIKDLINRGGEKIAPREVEEVLLEDPRVAEAVCFPLPHPTLGEDLGAAVVLKEGARATPGTLLDAAAARLSDFKVPRALTIVDDIPKGPSGKLQRAGLAERLGLRSPVPAAAEAFVPPTTESENLVAGIWAEVLGVEKVGAQDDFFYVGGDSVLATLVLSRVSQATGVELSFRIFFEAPTVAGMARAIQTESRRESGPRSISAARRSGSMPLSFAQERLWFLHQLEPTSPVYNVPIAVHLAGALEPLVLERTLDEIVRRHESLRTVFPQSDGPPVQVVLPAAAVALARFDLRGLPGAERQAEALRLATEEARRPFDLVRGPLLRAALWRIGDVEHLLLMTAHHIVIDAWSRGVFFRELGALYHAFICGQVSPLPDLPVQYADLAAWQRQRLQGRFLEEQLGYWRTRLGGIPARLDLSGDRPRPPVMTYRGAVERFQVPKSVAEALADLGRRQGATLYMVLLAGLQALLSRYAGQKDVVVGSPIANRTRKEFEDQIGFFVNTLVHRADLTDDPTFLELLAQVRESALGAYAHQDLPFEKLVDELKPERSLSHTPLFQVAFVLQNAPAQSLEVPGLKMTRVRVDTRTEKFDLTLELEGTPPGPILGELSYATDLFDPETAARLARHYLRLLESAAENPTRRVGELALLSEEERRRSLVEWNRTDATFPADRCLHQLVEEQAVRTPEAEAVVATGRRLSYCELRQRATRLAIKVRAMGARPNALVAVAMEKGWEQAVAVLAIHASGAAYLPVDPDLPAERFRYLLEHGDVQVALSQSRIDAQLQPSWPPGIRRICVDTESDEATDGPPPQTVQTSADLAYVLFTSGSTGVPKGVMIDHRGPVNTCLDVNERFSVGAADRVLALSELSFDLSVYDLFGVLAAGGAVVYPEPQAAPDPAGWWEVATRERITVWNSVPALMQLVVEHCEDRGLRLPPSLRLVMLSGDWIPLTLPDRIRALAPNTKVVSLGGATEASIWSILFPVDRVDTAWTSIPYGRPMRNQRFYVLDPAMEPCPPGVTGRLYIGGVGLARGYWKDTEKTSERFITHPRTGERLYWTGDLGRYRPDGVIEFLGREDFQVKVQGFRIELGEIESALSQHAGVAAAAATLCGERFGPKRIAAYVVPKGRPGPAADELRRHVKERLPPYMVPAWFLTLDALPLTPTGKVDRKRLPEPEPSAPALTAERPASQLETTLAAVWCELLEVGQVGVNDNFFELGGDSILAVRMVAKARQRGIELSPHQLFENPTVASLAAVAQVQTTTPLERPPESGRVPLTPIQRRFFENEPPEVAHYNLAASLTCAGPVDPNALAEALAAVISHHEALRLRFERRADGWHQTIAPHGGEAPVALIDLRGAGDLETARARHHASLNASLDIVKGPIVRLALFDDGAQSRSHLYLVVHHLAVDGVSLRILCDDLQTAYDLASRGEAIRLPHRTASFKQWAERVASYASSDVVRRELDFWTDEAHAGTRSLPLDFPGGANTEGSVLAVSTVLPARETQELIQRVPAAHQAHIDEVFLAAVSSALAEWMGPGSVLVDLEGHGRDAVSDGLDLSRTVGWFTSIFPVLVDLRPGASPLEALACAKERLRGVPARGAGYGVLRYLAGDEAERRIRQRPSAELLFNYLGQVDAGSREGFEVAWDLGGPLRGPGARRFQLLRVGAWVSQGELHVQWSYSGNLHAPLTIERLAGRFAECLRAFAAAGRSRHPS